MKAHPTRSHLLNVLAPNALIQAGITLPGLSPQLNGDKTPLSHFMAKSLTKEGKVQTTYGALHALRDCYPIDKKPLLLQYQMSDTHTLVLFFNSPHGTLVGQIERPSPAWENTKSPLTPVDLFPAIFAKNSTFLESYTNEYLERLLKTHFQTPLSFPIVQTPWQTKPDIPVVHWAEQKAHPSEGMRTLVLAMLANEPEPIDTSKTLFVFGLGLDGWGRIGMASSSLPLERHRFVVSIGDRPEDDPLYGTAQTARMGLWLTYAFGNQLCPVPLAEGLSIGSYASLAYDDEEPILSLPLSSLSSHDRLLGHQTLSTIQHWFNHARS